MGINEPSPSPQDWCQRMPTSGSLLDWQESVFCPPPLSTEACGPECPLSTGAETGHFFGHGQLAFSQPGHPSVSPTTLSLVRICCVHCLERVRTNMEFLRISRTALRNCPADFVHHNLNFANFCLCMAPVIILF